MQKGQTQAAKKAAEYMQKNPDALPMQVAVKFGVSISTVYRLKTAAKPKEQS
jgi:transposase